MQIKKPLLIVGAVSSVALASLAGAHGASAATSTTGVDNLIDKIATKFSLNKSDVQAVFDEDKATREAEHQSEISSRLQKKVDSGTITADQKTLIENKLKELQTAREAARTELQTWADQNGIDEKYLMGGGRHGSDDRLQTAVDNGDITAAQKTLIDQKRTELQDKMQAERDALTQWAKDNNLDLQDIGGFGGDHGPDGGPRGAF